MRGFPIHHRGRSIARAVLCLGLVLIALAPFGQGFAEEAKRPPLTPAFFRANCILCHKQAMPEGLAPAVYGDIKPPHPVDPRDAMPNQECWRHCVKCWRIPAPSRR